MTAGQLRVAVWSTGGIGSIAIRAIHQRPLDLVGVWVHSEDKVGKDAGELANGEPIGLATTNDADALIALAPDCVKLLSAGINVATTSTTRPVNPHAYEPDEWRDQLVAPRRTGRSRCTPRASSRDSPPTICYSCSPHSPRRSRRFTPTRSGCTTTTVCPTS